MKKIIIVFLSALAFVGNIVAQTEAKIGKEYTYTISATPEADSYHWNLTGGTNAIATVNSNSTKTVTFTWDNATAGQTYNMTVYGILNGCEGDDFTKTYKAVVDYSYTASWVKGYNTCPATTKNPNGGADASFDIKVTVNSGTGITDADQIKVSYMIDDVPQPAITKANTAGIVNIPVSFAGTQNETGAAIVKNITITAIQIIGRDAVSFANNDRPTGSVNINPEPVIKDID